MICVLGHEICGKKPQVGVLMTVTVWLLREGIVERKSNLRGNTGICSEAQLTLLMPPPAKQAHWAPGYGEEEKMSNSCRASRLHGLQVAPCFCWRKKKLFSPELRRLESENITPSFGSVKSPFEFFGGGVSHPLHTCDQHLWVGLWHLNWMRWCGLEIGGDDWRFFH